MRSLISAATVAALATVGLVAPAPAHAETGIILGGPITVSGPGPYVVPFLVDGLDEDDYCRAQLTYSGSYVDNVFVDYEGHDPMTIDDYDLERFGGGSYLLNLDCEYGEDVQVFIPVRFASSVSMAKPTFKKGRVTLSALVRRYKVYSGLRGASGVRPVIEKQQADGTWVRLGQMPASNSSGVTKATFKKQGAKLRLVVSETGSMAGSTSNVAAG